METLDQYFGNVCELDIVFNFNKVYGIIDELMIGGEVCESSKTTIVNAVKMLEVEDWLNLMISILMNGSKIIRFWIISVIVRRISYVPSLLLPHKIKWTNQEDSGLLKRTKLSLPFSIIWKPSIGLWLLSSFSTSILIPIEIPNNVDKGIFLC